MQFETLIIIRTKNEDRWIKATINKIKSQNYKKYKILVVDNHSNDRTLEILKKLNIDVISIKKFLPGKAINLAINSFKNTKYVVCLSAHCIPESNDWLKKLIKPLKNPKTVAVYGRQLPMYSTNPQDYRDLKLVFGNEKKIQKKDYFFHNANSSIKRSILKKYPFSDKATNMEDRIWSKQILSLNKNYQIVYEPDASVFHHHGLHHSNSKKRLLGVLKIIQSIEKDNLVPDILDLKNQKIYAVIIGKTTKINKYEYLKVNLKFIKQLEKNYNLKKIILVVDKQLENKLRNIKSEKFISLKRNTKINSLKVNEIIYDVYKRYKSEDIDYLIYFNLDYVSRPKKSIEQLLSSVNKKTADIVTFALEEKTNIWTKHKGIFKPETNQMGGEKSYKTFFNAKYGLGSIFFFNSLKNKNMLNKKIEMITLKNAKFLQRFSKQHYDE